jgi:hypothetical protein
MWESFLQGMVKIDLPNWAPLSTDWEVRTGPMRPGEYVTWKRITRTGLQSPLWVPNWNVGMVMMCCGGMIIGGAFVTLALLG